MRVHIGPLVVAVLGIGVLLLVAFPPTVDFSRAQVGLDTPLPLAKEEQRLVPGRPSAIRGAQVFQKQCALCHGPEGRGDGPAASKLVTPGRNLLTDFLGLFGIKVKAEQLPSRPANFHNLDAQRLNSPFLNYETVTLGRPHTAMPAFGPRVPYGANKGTTLTDQERWDVVFFEWEFQTSPERLSRAKEIYEGRVIEGNTCATCHGIAGDGRGPRGAEMAGTLWTWAAGRGPGIFTDINHLGQRKPSDLFQVIKNGSPSGLMPSYGGKLSEDEMWMLVEYVYTFLYDPKGQVK